VKLRAVIATVVAAASLFGSSTAAAKEHTPRWGERIGTIIIPRIGLNQPLFRGDRPSVFFKHHSFPPSLDYGPAVYPRSPLPWQAQHKTLKVAGHHVTHSQPFLLLFELRKGDLIVIKTPGYGEFHYRVLAQPKPTGGEWIDSWRRLGGLLLSSCINNGAERLEARAKLTWMRLPGQAPRTVQG
jgi:hypothetical protein